jgi:hypothetical protein
LKGSELLLQDGFEGLPGGELVRQGLDDLRAGEETELALLVLVAGPRLRDLGIDVSERETIRRPYEHRLYEKLTETCGDAAYSRYNSLIRRIVSFARALARERNARR